MTDVEHAEIERQAARLERLHYSDVVVLRPSEVEHLGCGGGCTPDGFCKRCGVALYSHNIKVRVFLRRAK